MREIKQEGISKSFSELFEEIDQVREICVRMYCLENIMDFEDASDYANAIMAVSKYCRPLTENESWILENEERACNCVISEYALYDKWNELISIRNEHWTFIKGALEKAREWVGKELKSLQKYGFPISEKNTVAIVSDFINACGNMVLRNPESNYSFIDNSRSLIEEKECKDSAEKIRKWMEHHRQISGVPECLSTKDYSLYSNCADKNVSNRYNEDSILDSANRIAFLFDVTGELSSHFYSWGSLRKDIIQKGRNLIEKGKEKIDKYLDERKRAKILRDEEAIKGSMEKVRTIIQDLKNGEHKNSPWYEIPAATCPNPWKDTSVTLLNPLKFFWYCKPVKECILYHEYQHHHQYEMWRRNNPKNPVGQYLNEVVPNEIQAYKSTLLCLDAQLKKIQLMRRKGEI